MLAANESLLRKRKLVLGGMLVGVIVGVPAIVFNARLNYLEEGMAFCGVAVAGALLGWGVSGLIDQCYYRRVRISLQQEQQPLLAEESSVFWTPSAMTICISNPDGSLALGNQQ